MTTYRSLFCDDEARRARVRAHETLNGIDYIEVGAGSLNAQRDLRVYFLKGTPPVGLADSPNAFNIEGGVRITGIQVVSVSANSDHLMVEVDKPGDFSTYTLVIASAALDPAFQRCDFSFKAGCPSRFDCRPQQVCPPEPQVEPLIDYMARDYASFRQALLDLIPTLAPQWTERHEADLGIALVELLAYVGDQLSYYQDAAANEAYLETARQRISVRRHARLIDYRMHDGASARAFVHFTLKGDPAVLPKGTPVLSRLDAPPGYGAALSGPVIPSDFRQQALDAAEVVFETLAEARLDVRLNGIPIHAWGNRQCCLPRGTTTVDLAGNLTDCLHAGDYLLFEEVKGPTTGAEADANPAHRQVVRLTTDPEKLNDLLDSIDVTRIVWDRADALAFPLCLSAKLADGAEIEDVSVARGNLVLADHGRRVEEERYPGDPADPRAPRIRSGPRAYRFSLQQGPLSFRIAPPADNGRRAPASALWQTDPRQASPQIINLETTAAGSSTTWQPVPRDLLEGSGPLDTHFMVETDNEGRAQIRFGDGVCGMRAPDAAQICTTYRVGVGRSGNVGTDALAHVIEPDPEDYAGATDEEEKMIAAAFGSIVGVRNPLPAWGGVDPESMEQVKRLAPAAFHAEQFRAVTEADHARVAEKHPLVAKAVAMFRWTGSWHTVFITVDPLGRSDLPAALQQSIKDWVARFTLAGYDLEIAPPTYVPLEIEIDICVCRDHFRAHVEEALLTALSSYRLPDNKLGFFHPDNFTFGQALHLSQLYAAVEAVPGVDSAVVRRFIRQDQDDPDPHRPATRRNLDQGWIDIGRLEVLQLDNDPNFPENGVLRLILRGGK